MQEMEEMLVRSLGREDLLEEGTATHSSILAWRIPWTEEPGRLQSTRLQSQTGLSDLKKKNSIHIYIYHECVLWKMILSQEESL